ncbi:hypothetical protein, partial [Escherichia coli]|uniref:hypothetical protein n=1 Tax=Escherichia coli TaxID=562 RepID=UPI001962FC46
PNTLEPHISILNDTYSQRKNTKQYIVVQRTKHDAIFNQKHIFKFKRKLPRNIWTCAGQASIEELYTNLNNMLYE